MGAYVRGLVYVGGGNRFWGLNPHPGRQKSFLVKDQSSMIGGTDLSTGIKGCCDPSWPLSKLRWTGSEAGHTNWRSGVKSGENCDVYRARKNPKISRLDDFPSIEISELKWPKWQSRVSGCCQVGNTSSHLNTEVKQHWARIVLGWELQVLLT